MQRVPAVYLPTGPDAPLAVGLSAAGKRRRERAVSARRRHAAGNSCEEIGRSVVVARGEQMMNRFFGILFADVVLRRSAMDLLSALRRNLRASMQEVREERVIAIATIVRNE